MNRGGAARAGLAGMLRAEDRRRGRLQWSPTRDRAAVAAGRSRKNHGLWSPREYIGKDPPPLILQDAGRCMQLFTTASATIRCYDLGPCSHVEEAGRARGWWGRRQSSPSVDFCIQPSSVRSSGRGHAPATCPPPIFADRPGAGWLAATGRAGSWRNRILAAGPGPDRDTRQFSAEAGAPDGPEMPVVAVNLHGTGSEFGAVERCG